MLTVVKASDWITNKQIKVPILVNDVSPAEFRAWVIKFEKYLKFSKVLELWDREYHDISDVSDGFLTQFDKDQWHLAGRVRWSIAF